MEQHHLMVISSSIGNGHNQAAKAFISGWEASGYGSAHFIDFLEAQTPPDRFAQWGYEMMIQHAPWSYEFLYRISDFNLTGSLIRTQCALSMKARLMQLIENEGKEIHGLAFTHPSPANAASWLKKKGQLSLPLAGIVTDFVIHELWADTGLDLYCVPHEEQADKLIKIGIPSHKIHATGIPISEPFWAPPIPQPQQAKLHLLIAGGGWGMGPLKEAYQTLESLSVPCKVTFIAGKNQPLEEEMKNLIGHTKHDLTVLGYTDKIAEYMESADLLISKAGGLTTSEALSRGTPLLLLPGRAGQEEDNAQFIEKHGAAISLHRVKDIPRKIEELLRTPSSLVSLSENALALGRPSAAKDSANWMNQLLNS